MPPVTVTGIDRQYNWQTTSQRRGEPTLISVNGKPVGWQIADNVPPGEVFEIRVFTSDGGVYSVFNKPMVVEYNVLLEYCPINLNRKNVFPTEITICGNTYSLKEAAALRIGTELVPTQPFRFDIVNQVLTNGEIAIPFSRPRGREWNNYPQIQCLKAVNQHNWLAMLEALEGKFLGDVLKPSEKEEMPSLAREQEAQVKLAREVLMTMKHGQCYSSSSARCVHLGPKLVFELAYASGEIYLVDSPQFGVGLYVFASYNDALAWATGAVNFRVARERALLFTTHKGAWSERLHERLAA